VPRGGNRKLNFLGLTEAAGQKSHGRAVGRTGFTGALPGCRVGQGSNPRRIAEMHTFSGRTIDVPSQYIAGKSDWGPFPASPLLRLPVP
jgi:hypothetical protein